MDFQLTIVDLAGRVALLLWGTHIVQTGIRRAFGARLRDPGPRLAQRRIKRLVGLLPSRVSPEP